MIKKLCIAIFASIIIGIGLFFGYKYYIKYTIGYTKVYIASHQLSQRKQIDEDDLIEIEVPKDYLNDDIYINKEDILNKFVKLSYSIPKGSFIYKGAVESNIGDYANTLLKNNEVNYDIYTNDTKINTANLAKNMYIDIYLTIENKDNPISDLILSNARITGLYDSDSKPIQDYDNNNKVYSISIAINKEDVNFLNKAQVIGKISCIISNNTYDTNLRSSVNKNSKLFEYIE